MSFLQADNGVNSQTWSINISTRLLSLNYRPRRWKPQPQSESESLTCHGFYDNSEVSSPVCQGDVTSTLFQMSNSLQVAPSRLGELCGVGFKENNTVQNCNIYLLRANSWTEQNFNRCCQKQGSPQIWPSNRTKVTHKNENYFTLNRR